MEIPAGIAIDVWGNIYIGDYGNSRLRKIDHATGIVTSLVIGGSIDGVAADNNGNIYFSDASGGVVKKIDALGRITTLVTGLAYPAGLYANISGDLFICESSGGRVRMLNTSTGVLTTIAGTGALGFSGDGGSPLAAELNSPTGVWQDQTGAIYIADAGNNRIRKITGAVAYRTTGTNTLTTSDVTIFPNPSAGTFTVRTNIYPVNGTVEVYNVVGEKVFTGTIDQQETTITLDQPAGLYSVMLRTSTGNVIQKISIAK